MQVRIMLQLVGNDGAVGGAEEIGVLTKVTERAEDLDLWLAESKTPLAAAQQRIVEAQVDCWLEKYRHCPISGRKLRCKGSYTVTFRTLFGDVRLKSPRYYVPKEHQTNGPATISPVTQLLPEHVAPELLYLETRWGSPVHYVAAADLLGTSPRSSRCSGAGAGRTCSYRRGPGPWMPRFVPHSSTGTQV
jgi:hypothetical protein